MAKPLEPKDQRVDVTARIWGIAAGMLAICIPLSPITRSGPILPFAVITGAAVGTVAVWQSSEQKLHNRIEDSQKIKELEERIANLETIVATGEIDWQRQIQPTLTSNNPPQALPEKPPNE